MTAIRNVNYGKIVTRRRRKQKTNNRDVFKNLAVAKNVCTRSMSSSINRLPVEILLKIFSYLSNKDVFCVVKRVCVKWCLVSKSACLWQTIRAKEDLSTDLLLKWLDTAPKLKRLELNNRKDLGIVLKKVVRRNRRLEEIKLHNCWGSQKQVNIPSIPLCNMILKCTHLSEISLKNCHFLSCKFFRILAKKNFHEPGTVVQRPATLRPVNFIGNANIKQLKAFLAARQELNLSNQSMISVRNGTNMRLSDFMNTGDLDTDIERVLDALFEELE